MNLKDFANRARTTLASVRELTGPISGLSPNLLDQDLSQELSRGETVEAFGDVSFSGDVAADLRITRSAEPPIDLTNVQDDPAQDTAYASLILRGKAKVDADSKEITSGSVSGSAGVQTGSQIAFAQHRRYPSSEKAITAMVDLLTHPRQPFSESDAALLEPSEVLQLDFQGSVTLRADAGWSYGFSRELSGNTLTQISGGQTLGLQADVRAGLTLTAGLSGELSIQVSRSDRTTDAESWVRIQLRKHNSDFVGAGLSLSSTLSVVQLEDYFDSIFEKSLELPPNFVDKLQRLDGSLEAVQKQLETLQARARKKVEKVLGKTTDEIALDDLETLSQTLDALPPSQRSAASDQLQSDSAEASSLVGKFSAELTSFVDDLFGKAGQPLTKARNALANWNDRYLKLLQSVREKVLGKTLDRARQGIEMEIAGGINRTRSGEALLDLDLRIHAEDSGLAHSVEQVRNAYRAALRGRFVEALSLARLPGANGVELRAGSLKRATQVDRQLGVQLNFFGFQLKRDLKSYTRIEVDTDLTDNSAIVVGKAGSALAAKVRDEDRLRSAEELLFTFDLYSARRSGSAFVLGNRDTGYASTLTRQVTLASGKRTKELIRRHVLAAADLLVSRDRAEALLEKLLAARGTYTYDLELSFPPQAMEGVFQTFSEVRSLNHHGIEPALWSSLRRSFDHLGIDIPAVDGSCPISEVMTPELIAEIQASPGVPTADRLPRVRHPRYRFPEGVQKQVWVYTSESNQMIRAYLAVRDEILRNNSLKRATQALRHLAREVAEPPGLFAIRPLAAKYLMLALLEGPVHTKVRMTFQRGDVAVTLENPGVS